jgi:hypothetical protein
VTSGLPSVLPVWAIAIAGAVLVGTLAKPGATYGWLSIVLVAVVLATFIIQLALSTKEGLVIRTAASIGGSVIVLAVATGVLAVANA